MNGIDGKVNISNTAALATLNLGASTIAGAFIVTHAPALVTLSVPRLNTRAQLGTAAFAGPTERERLSERAHQDRDIVYCLQAPESNALSLCLCACASG